MIPPDPCSTHYSPKADTTGPESESGAQFEVYVFVLYMIPSDPCSTHYSATADTIGPESGAQFGAQFGPESGAQFGAQFGAQIWMSIMA